MNLDDAYTEFLTNQVAPPPAPSVPEPAPKQENKQDTSFGDTLLELGRSALDLPDAVIRGSLKGLGEGVYAAGLVNEEQINKFRSMMGAASELAVTEGVNPIATGLVEDVSQIAPAAIPAFKVLRGFGMARPAAAIIAEGIGGALGYNPDDPNLGNMISGMIGKDGQGPLSQAMRMLSTNPEDPDIVNRARNMLQDTTIGSAFEGVFKAIQKAPDAGRAALDWFNDTARSAQQGTAFSGIPTRVNRELDNPAGDVWNEPLPAEPAPVFYSAVANAVDGLPMEKGNASQMRAMIVKSAEVKPEEMAWIGLDDFLKGKKSVTKQEIKDFVDANQVRIEEVVKGGREIDADYITELQEAEARNTVAEYDIEFDADEGGFVTYLYGEPLYDFGGELRLTKTKEEAQEILYDQALESAQQMPEGELLERAGSDIGNTTGPGGLTKFSDYTLPGGENYREVLLRLPDTEILSYTPDNVIPIRAGEDMYATDPERFWYFKTPDNVFQILKSEHPTELSAQQYILKTKQPSMGKYLSQNFTGGHYDESNVLAHMRLNDRTGPDGEKILFVEEIQSDWHQIGRKVGYQKPSDIEFGPNDVVTSPVLPDGWQIVPARQFDDGAGNVPEDILEKVSNDGYVIIDGRTDSVAYGETRLDAMRDYYKIYDQPVPNDIPFVALPHGSRSLGEVPDAPLKKTWHEMSFRRIARMAAEEGYDAIAWTPGKLQAERYDLSTKVDGIEVIPEGNNQVEIMVKAKGEDSYKTLATNVSEDKIADYIGKDLAEKAMRQIGDNSADYYALSREFDAFKKRVRDGEVLSDADGDRMNEVDRLLDLPTEGASLKGVDLEVGGEGMKGFYDKMLKGYAAKWGKKFGAKVGVTDINADGPASVLQIVDSSRGGVTVIDRATGDEVSDFTNRESAERYIQKELSDTKVWTLPVTKKMRDSVLGKGVATFSAAGVAAGVNNEARPNGN